MSNRNSSNTHGTASPDAMQSMIALRVGESPYGCTQNQARR